MVDVQAFYEQYKDKGLEVLWVLGETADEQPVSYEWAEAFVEEKGATFTVVRDYKFYQVYGAIEPHSNSLPHQYVIDASNMELLFAAGGISQEVEDLVFGMMED